MAAILEDIPEVFVERCSVLAEGSGKERATVELTVYGTKVYELAYLNFVATTSGLSPTRTHG
jgi:hypothetical protein